MSVKSTYNDDRFQQLVDFVQSELHDVTERLNRGRGEWPKKNYVTEAAWNRRQAEQSTLERVLRHIECYKTK